MELYKVTLTLSIPAAGEIAADEYVEAFMNANALDLLFDQLPNGSSLTRETGGLPEREDGEPQVETHTQRTEVHLDAWGFRLYDTQTRSTHSGVWSQRFKALQACADLNEFGSVRHTNRPDREVV